MCCRTLGHHAFDLFCQVDSAEEVTRTTIFAAVGADQVESGGGADDPLHKGSSSISAEEADGQWTLFREFADEKMEIIGQRKGEFSDRTRRAEDGTSPEKDGGEPSHFHGDFTRLWELHHPARHEPFEFHERIGEDVAADDHAVLGVVCLAVVGAEHALEHHQWSQGQCSVEGAAVAKRQIGFTGCLLGSGDRERPFLSGPDQLSVRVVVCFDARERALTVLRAPRAKAGPVREGDLDPREAR